MFARVHLDLGSLRDAVLIPREGLVYRGSQPGVFLIERNRSTFRPIETGQTMGNDVEVLGGLAPGTTIVLRGASMLREGDEVRITSQIDPSKVTESEKSPQTMALDTKR